MNEETETLLIDMACELKEAQQFLYEMRKQMNSMCLTIDAYIVIIDKLRTRTEDQLTEDEASA